VGIQQSSQVLFESLCPVCWNEQIAHTDMEHSQHTKRCLKDPNSYGDSIDFRGKCYEIPLSRYNLVITIGKERRRYVTWAHSTHVAAAVHADEEIADSFTWTA
jgi:hypothetical protein